MNEQTLENERELKEKEDTIENLRNSSAKSIEWSNVSVSCAMCAMKCMLAVVVVMVSWPALASYGKKIRITFFFLVNQPLDDWVAVLLVYNHPKVCLENTNNSMK